MFLKLQSSPSRKILPYSVLVVLLICIGLPARLTDWYPPFVVTYVGDGLWAMMIYFLAAIFLPKFAPIRLFILCMIVTWLIEFSQLYQADWINTIRHLPLMGLILGYGFRVEDLIVYTIGILLGLMIDLFIIDWQTRAQQSGS